MRLKCLCRNYLIALGHGDRRFVAIPVFPSRVFRHSYIWINANSRHPRAERSCIGKTGRHRGLLNDGVTLRSGYAQNTSNNVLPEDISLVFGGGPNMCRSKRRANLRIDNIEKRSDSRRSTGRGQAGCGGGYIASAKLPKRIAPREAALPGCQADRVRSTIVERKSFQSCTLWCCGGRYTKKIPSSQRR